MKPWYVNLREAIKKSGMTQSQVADRLGIRQPSVSQWLSGMHMPSLKNLKKLGAILNMSLDEMLGDEYILLEADDEKGLVEKYRDLQDRDKQTLLALLASLSERKAES